VQRKLFSKTIMTIPFFPNLQMAFTIACLLMIAGCEDPTPKEGQITPPAPEVSAEKEIPASKPDVASAEQIPEVKADKKEAPGPKESEYPYLHVYREGEKLVIEGALKSNGQIEQMGRELETYFAKLEVENHLTKDPYRHAVGWGNRIGDAVLFDYFTVVEDPDLEYKEGVVTLKGTVKNSRDHRQITEKAIAGFSGVWTSDLVNEIKVAK
jgi:hypothetical protein